MRVPYITVCSLSGFWKSKLRSKVTGLFLKVSACGEGVCLVYFGYFFTARVCALLLFFACVFSCLCFFLRVFVPCLLFFFRVFVALFRVFVPCLLFSGRVCGFFVFYYVCLCLFLRVFVPFFFFFFLRACLPVLFGCMCLVY